MVTRKKKKKNSQTLETGDVC